MSQLTLNFPLNDFEQATLEQLISYKAKTEDDIERLMMSESLINKAKELVLKWNKTRIEIGLSPWR